MSGISRPGVPSRSGIYEDYDQLENGVGMMSLFRQEFLAELDKPHRIYGTKKLDVVTGTIGSPLIIEMMEELHRQYPMIEVTVHPIRNSSLAATWAWRAL